MKLLATLCLIAAGLPAQTATMRVGIAGPPLNSFDPDSALGSSDGARSRITYRNNTELRIVPDSAQTTFTLPESVGHRPPR